jgi:hypothetical protein
MVVYIVSGFVSVFHLLSRFSEPKSGVPRQHFFLETVRSFVSSLPFICCGWTQISQVRDRRLLCRPYEVTFHLL